MKCRYCLVNVGLLCLTLTNFASAIAIRQKRNANRENEHLPPNPDDKPDTNIRMNIPIGDEVVTLNLERNDVINATLPVFLGTGRHSFVQLDNRNKDDFVVYQDLSRQASFVLWNQTGRGSSPAAGMRGVFDNRGQTFSMEPLDRRQTSRDPIPGGQEPVLVTIYGTDLAMTPVNKSELLDNEEEQFVSEDIVNLQENIDRFINQSEAQGHIYPHSYYEVELFLVADYAIFEKFVLASREIHYADRELEAIDNIRFYFAHVLNGISIRYRTARGADFQIGVRPVGLYIAKTPEASYFTESYPIKEEYHFTEAYKALDAFEDWINLEEANLPPFDQATLFSGNDLFSGYYNGRRRTINGLADIMGVCGYRRASINHDIGQYGSIQTGAHELGHNLGAYHDGYNNECSSREQYIMATSPGTLTEVTAENPLQFSYCTNRAFREHLLFLNSDNSNCLLESSNYNTYWNLDYYLQTHPGQRYSAEEQCKLIHGTQSFYCGGGDRDESLCEAMYCWVPSQSRCSANVEQRAFDGTQCGSRKWCVNSECVYDSRAPPSPNTGCLYGDYKDVVVPEKGYRCVDLGESEPHMCYQDQLRAQCCETCARVQSQDNTCHYGDRDPAYCSTHVHSFNCYDSNVRDLCCQTCQRHHRNVVGCEYGDKQRRCGDVYSEPHLCYNDNSTCCESCPRLQTDVQDCEWGNKAAWCSTHVVSQRQCYDSNNDDTCCGECNGLRESGAQAGCEWGDRSSACRVDDCDTASDSRLQDCCKTCAAYTGTGNPSSCPLGDQYSWCQRYVSSYGATACVRDALVRDGCCLSCAAFVSGDTCTDSALWCQDILPSYCYDAGVEQTCCARCRGVRQSYNTPDCRYGDRYSWCQPKYCDTNSAECCQSC